MTRNPSATNWGIHILRGVLGAVFGLAVMVPFLRFAGPFLAQSGTGAIALSGVGVIYLLMGLMVGLGTLMPGPGSKLLNVAGPDDLTDQRRVLLGSAAASLFVGAALLALSLAGPAGLVPDGLALGALALAFLLCVVIGVLQWREYDELMRQMSTDCGSIAFMMALPGLGAWAALAHLGRVPPFAPLWVLAAMALALLIASFIAAGRRGLLIQDPD
ncbi:MAG: hypothetical protein ABL926_00665 [Novosphingobium sp.]|uniref:hypothetical protein n=1 Tax=Novosphingobium sp. TaxID=1874826 RepID=UPI0032B7954F